MRQYPFFKAILFSFFSAELYQDIARRRHGLGFLYIFLLLLITTAITTVMLASVVGRLDIRQGIEDFYQQEMQEKNIRLEDVLNSGLNMLSQLPAVAFKDGKAMSSVPQPYSIIEPITGKPFFVIDTTGQVTGLQGQDAKLLLRQDALVVRKNNDREEVRYFGRAKAEDEQELTYIWNIVEQLPLLQVKDGKASTGVPQPYEIKAPGTGDTLGTIDTTGKLALLKEAKGRFLLTNTHLYLESTSEQGQPEELTFDLANLKEEALMAFLDDMVPSLKKIAIVLLLLFIPVAALFKWIVVILGVLVLGLAGMLFATLLRVPGIPYETAVRLASMAATPAIIASAFLPLSVWVCFLAALAYVFFAVVANRETVPPAAIHSNIH